MNGANLLLISAGSFGMGFSGTIMPWPLLILGHAVLELTQVILIFLVFSGFGSLMRV